MLVAFWLTDRADSAALRATHLAAHRAYLGALAERMAFAGPLVAADGETATGSLLVIDFESVDAARAWLRDEPFTRAGVYVASEVVAFRNRWVQRTGFPEPM